MGHPSATGRLRVPNPMNIWAHLSNPPLPSIFIGDVSPMDVIGYIRRFHVTDEYIVTFIGTDEYLDLNLLKLYSSVDSSVNK
jgi:hypothetical protein